METKELDQLLKMVNLITYGLRELIILFKAVRVPSIGLTGRFNVLEYPMELFKVRLNNNNPVVQTARKKLSNFFIHSTNIQYILLKWKYYFIIPIYRVIFEM